MSARLGRWWRALRRWWRGRRRRELTMKGEVLEMLAELRQTQEQQLRDSGEHLLDLLALRQPQAPEVPLLDAYDDGTSWRVWCRYCQHWHRHSRGPGHRIAHCIALESPYRETGYTLRWAGTWDEAPHREREG